jgi:hypothetical protein
MRKEVNMASLVILAVVGLLILNAIDNPRLAALRGVDILRLITIGLGFGVAFGTQVGARVFGRKASQP